MITVPTTFVVGAGGSVSYHLPVGRELLKRAAAVDSSLAIYQVIVNAGPTIGKLNDCLRDCRHQQAPSIDTVLESRIYDLDEVRVGKMLIALLLADPIKRININQRPNEDDDWLGYVIEKMREGATRWAEFAEGNKGVRFVTFNFDRLIEERLRRELRAIFRDSDDDEIAARFPVVHVHGELPQPPPHGIEDVVGMPRAEWIRWAQGAAEAIHVVSEEIDEAVLKTAKAAVERSQVVCFLGFSYHPTNLRRLGFGRERNTLPDRLFGSAHGMLDGERAAVRRFLGEINLGDPLEGCRYVLRKFDVFR